DRATTDLGQARQLEAGVLREAEKASVREAIDQLRAADGQQQFQPAVEQQPEAGQQPVEQPKQPVDDESTAALREQKVLAAVQEYVGQANQQAEALANYYAAAVQQNAQLTLAGFQSRNPELRNIPMENWGAVLQSINQTNPQRASQILAEFDNAKTVL